jgi:hypothetical protein
MNNLELYKEVKIPSLVKEVKDIFPYADILSNKLNTSKSLYSVSTINFLNENNETYKPFIKIVEKYPFLQKFFRILKIEPNFSLAIHLDGLEKTNLTDYNLNIPISGCTNESITEFYKIKPEHIYTDLKKNTRFVIDGSPIEKIDEYKMLDNPFLCHTQIPHRVINNSNLYRVSISWAVKKEWTIKSIINFLKE